MEHVPLVAPVLTILQKLETIVNKYYERDDIRKDNKSQLHQLKRQYAMAANVLDRLQRVSSPDFVNLARLGLYESMLQRDMQKLTAWEESIKNAKRTGRVKRMKEILDQCQDTVEKFFEFAGDKISPMLQSQPSQQDVAGPSYAAPVNPPRLIQEHNTTGTSEERLKGAVLRETKSQLVGVCKRRGASAHWDCSFHFRTRTETLSMPELGRASLKSGLCTYTTSTVVMKSPATVVISKEVQLVEAVQNVEESRCLLKDKPNLTP